MDKNWSGSPCLGIQFLAIITAIYQPISIIFCMENKKLSINCACEIQDVMIFPIFIFWITFGGEIVMATRGRLPRHLLGVQGASKPNQKSGPVLRSTVILNSQIRFFEICNNAPRLHQQYMQSISNLAQTPCKHQQLPTKPKIPWENKKS